ncbi:Fic family protein [Pseudonocardia kujensis]|nr:Fic family protein [Pseudonocardia kujensis]
MAIAKEDLFCLPQHIESFAEDIFGKLARRDDYLRGLGRPEFLDKLTELLADLNALHPFREGNGRAQRAFLAQLARAAGHPLHWEAMDPNINITASQAAHRGDAEPLRQMLEQLVQDPDRSAADEATTPEHPARAAGAALTSPEDGRGQPRGSRSRRSPLRPP